MVRYPPKDENSKVNATAGKAKQAQSINNKDKEGKSSARVRYPPKQEREKKVKTIKDISRKRKA